VPRGGSGSYLIDINRARDFVAVLSSAADMVVINAAPVHRSGSTLIWARTTEACMIVAQRDVTKRENLVHALDSFRFIDTNVLGVAMYERRWSPFTSTKPTQRARTSVDNRRRGAFESEKPVKASAPVVGPEVRRSADRDSARAAKRT